MIKFLDKRSGARARRLARANLFSLRLLSNSTSPFNANFFCVLDSYEGCDVSDVRRTKVVLIAER